MASRRLVVANITLQSSRWDYDEQVKFSGRSFRLVRIGTNGDLKLARAWGPPATRGNTLVMRRSAVPVPCPIER